MIKLRWIIVAIILITKASLGQNLMILSPEHLAINNSTARVANHLLSNSGMAQSYYQDFSTASLSLYLPYSQLTDGRISTSVIQFHIPTYQWGNLKFSYADNTIQNFKKPVYSIKMLQLGFAKNIFQRLILATSLKWNNFTWYSDLHSEISVNGYSADLSSVFIINGYSSLGVSLENIYRSMFSSVRGDGEPRNLRIAYNRLNDLNIFSWEGGFIFSEDSKFNYQPGGFISSTMNIPYAFSIGAEYKYLNHHELGTFIGFIYRSNNLLARISYGMRFDNSSLPGSTYRHALGIQFTLKRSKNARKITNPQILLRDNEPPFLTGKRISNYTALKSIDESDILKVLVDAKDPQSGLANVMMTIVPSTDTTDIVYNRTIKLDNQLSFLDTLYFDGVLPDNNFLQNGNYFLKIIVKDQVGNSSKTSKIPFQLLAHRNDHNGPHIGLSYDTSSVNLEADVKNYNLSAKVSVADIEGSPLSWWVTLHRSFDDSTWTKVKTMRGQIKILNQKLQWSLKGNPRYPISGFYKLHVEAQDALDNRTVLWSGTKRLFQEAIEPYPEDNINSENATDILSDAKIKGISEFTVYDTENMIPKDSLVNRFAIKTTYTYRGKVIELSDFVFDNNQPFNTYVNRKGLHIIGVYLQDLPKSTLIVQTSFDLPKLPESEINLVSFLNEAYGISKDRIKFEKIKGKSSFHFLIKE